MKTIITKTDTYKFNELSEESQEKAINNLRDINEDSFNNFDDYFLIDFIEEVQKDTGLNLNTEDIIYEVGGRGDKFGVLSRGVFNAIIEKYNYVSSINFNIIDIHNTFKKFDEKFKTFFLFTGRKVSIKK